MKPPNASLLTCFWHGSFLTFRQRANLYLAVLVMAWTVLSSHAIVAQEAPVSPWNQIATALATQLPADDSNQKLRVGVLEFLFQDTEETSPFSTFLRGELEKSLVETGRFEPITRDRLADLQLEGKFQSSSAAKPSGAAAKVAIEGVDAMVRGRFFLKEGQVTVQTELVWLDGGRVLRASNTVSEAAIPVAVLPKTGRAGMAGLGNRQGLPTVAVLYFENASKRDQDLEAFAGGLLGMMITGLGETGRYNVLERARIDEVLKELELSASDKVDAETGAKIGKLLGAQYLVYGSALGAFGQYRIDARMVQVETGAIISTGSAGGKSDEIFELAAGLSGKISEGDNVNPRGTSPPPTSKP